MKFIQYDLSGEIIEQYSCDFNQIKDNPISEKVRVTMNDGEVYIGFWDTFLGQSAVQTAELRSSNSLVTFIPASRIAKIEAISHSNPR